MKKVLILSLLVLTLIFSTCYAQFYNDLDNQSEEMCIAIDTVSDLNCDGQYIFRGYPDNSFGPNKKLTRAEFAKSISIVTGNGQPEACSSSSFSDVPDGHWALDFIESASRLGLVNSSGDEFRPEECITYQEVIYGLVNALGYKAVTEGEGSYPTAWLNKAVELNLTHYAADITADAAATRGNVALLIFNTLMTNNYNAEDTLASRYFGLMTNVYHFHKASSIYEVGQVESVSSAREIIEIGGIGYKYCPDSKVEIEDIAESDVVFYRPCFMYEDGSLVKKYAEVKSVFNVTSIDNALVIDGNKLSEMESEDLEDYLPLTNGKTISLDTDNSDYNEHKDYAVYDVTLNGKVGENIQIASVDRVPQRGHEGINSCYLPWCRILIDDTYKTIIVFTGVFEETIGTKNGKFVTINPDENHKSKL